VAKDQSALRVILPAFQVHAQSGSTLHRETCAIAVPIQVPKSRRLSVMAIDVKVASVVEAGNAAYFSMESFFAPGIVSEKLKHDVVGAAQRVDPLRHRLGMGLPLIRYKCGESVILRTQMAMMIEANTGIASQSVDSQSGIRYALQWDQCGGVQ
jgi:hypothetical protein